MNTYLVTGGLGVVGSRFVESVCGYGYSAIVIDAAEESRNVWMEEYLMSKYPNQLTIYKNRLESFDLAPVLAKSDFILHAAAHTGIPHSEKDPTDDWASNVDASRHLLEVMREGQFFIPTVMLSSVKPYRVHDLPTRPDGDRTVWDYETAGVDESCLLEPDEPYAASKMAQSALGMAYARTYKLPVTVLRCSNLYGDAPCHGRRHGWLTWFCISAAMGWDIELEGTGLQTRDMLFSDDVAAAVFAAFGNIKSVSGNVYNIGGGAPNSISCKQAVSKLVEMVGPDSVTHRFVPGRQNEDMLFVTDHSKFTKATFWLPKVSVCDGMKRIYDWAVANRSDLERLYVG